MLHDPQPYNLLPSCSPVTAAFEPVWEAGKRKSLHFQEAISCGTNGAQKLQPPVVQQQSRSGGGRTQLAFWFLSFTAANSSATSFVSSVK